DLLAADIPYPVTFIAGLIFGGLIGAILELTVARPLKDRPHLTIGLATLGALLVIEGLLGLRYGFAPSGVPQLFTGGSWGVGQVALSSNQLFVAVLGAAATAGLFVLVMRTRLGIQMRAVSSGPL